MPLTNSGDAFLPIHQLSAKIARQELTPSMLTELYLERIERWQSKLAAFVNIYAEDALQAAHAASKMLKAGHRLGPLHGIPIAIKDLVEIDQRITTGGAALWRGRKSTLTASLVRKLMAAGMIIIGKTHTVEFAYGGWGTNQHMGTPWNPWDLQTHRVPGGSSSGSAVATAAGLCAAAIGSDTGGSVRLPSAFCGLVGLKTTVGRISTDGVLPLCRTLDTVGPLTRSVEDAALVYRALNDNTQQCGLSDPLPTLRQGVAGMRFAVLPESEREHANTEILSAYDASLDIFRKLGASLVNVDLPRSFADCRDAIATLIACEGYSELADLVDRDDLQLDQHVRKRLAVGRDIHAREYILALREREQAICDLAVAMDGIDALITPTTAATAIPVAQVDEESTPAYFTRFGNFHDLCSLALPNGFDSSGLPISLLINGPRYAESKVLRIGWAFEQAAQFNAKAPAGLIN